MEPTVVDMREVLADPREGASPVYNAGEHLVPAGVVIAAIDLVEAVTAGMPDEAYACTVVQCPRRRDGGPCPCELAAWIERDDRGAQRLCWSCLECGQRGVIIGFEGSRWDLSTIDPPRLPELPYHSAMLTREAYGWARIAADGSPICERLVKGARIVLEPTGSRIALCGPPEWFAQLRERAAGALIMAKGVPDVEALTRLLQDVGPEFDERWTDRLEYSPLCLHADLDVHGWALDDGQARHVAHPDSFWVPDLAERTSLLPGSIVKLIFAIRSTDGELGFERMWVVVERALGNLFVGRLDNEPVTGGRLAPGHPIFFSPEHVIDIWTDESEPM